MIPVSLLGQEKRIIYRTKIQFLNGDVVRGYLTAWNDSSIQIVTSARPRKDIIFPVHHIRAISLRRKHAIGRGFLIGFGIGAGLGGIIGYAAYTPPDCAGAFLCFDFGPAFSVLAGAILGSGIGSIFGGAIGSGYYRYGIYGDVNKNVMQRNKFLNGKKARRRAG